jgi:hypothetical protein
MSRQFIPASGWCFFHWDSTRTSVAIYDVALWEVREDGSIVGLISPEHPKDEVPALSIPPRAGGRYFLKGSDADPREWPTSPKILASWPDEYSVARE